MKNTQCNRPFDRDTQKIVYSYLTRRGVWCDSFYDIYVDVCMDVAKRMKYFYSYKIKWSTFVCKVLRQHLNRYMFDDNLVHYSRAFIERMPFWKRNRQQYVLSDGSLDYPRITAELNWSKASVDKLERVFDEGKRYLCITTDKDGFIEEHGRRFSPIEEKIDRKIDNEIFKERVKRIIKKNSNKINIEIGLRRYGLLDGIEYEPEEICKKLNITKKRYSTGLFIITQFVRTRFGTSVVQRIRARKKKEKELNQNG